MSVETTLCSRFRTPKSDCSFCIDVCPVNAIKISDEGAEIKEGCIDCGVCYSACPNGALRIKGRDDRKIIEEIRSEVTGQKSEIFRISCEHGDRTADLVVPCLSRLTEALLLEAARAASVKILRPPCQGCPSAKASSHLDRIIQSTSCLYEMMDIRDALHVTHCTFSPIESRTQNSEPEILSRRELFMSFSVKAAGIASASIPDIGQKNKESGEIFREAIQNRHENLKRSILLKSIGNVISNPDSRAVEPVNVPSENAILSDVEIASGCMGCGVCAKLCPTGAITQCWTEDRFRLSFSARLCTNCRICVKTCLYNAVKTKDTVSLNLLLEQKEVVLFEANRNVCAVCKIDFTGDGSDLCPLCMNRHKKQTKMIQKLFK